MPELFSLSSDALPVPVGVLGFRATEALSLPYRFEVAFTLRTGADLEPRHLLRERASFAMRRDGVTSYVVHGVLDAVELFHEYRSHAVYMATLVPTLQRLADDTHSRVYTDRSVPEIAQELLDEIGLGAEDVEVDLSSAYPKLEHVCQYRETNLAFFQRLLEREGIYFYFRQGVDKETLVITDHAASHVSLLGGKDDQPVAYTALNPGEAPHEQGFATFRSRATPFARAVEIRDYDSSRPALDVRATAGLAGGFGRVVTFGETDRSTDLARQHAVIRAGELRASGERYVAWGRALDLRSGYRFRLEGHTKPSLNQSYLAVRIEHEGNDCAGDVTVERRLGLSREQTYLATVEAIPAELPFRPARVTQVPCIAGLVEGVIDGPNDSPYAQLDEGGRYKVRMKFDESGLPPGKASMWVRMVQPLAGSPEGFCFPLRKGAEVQIMFVGGDPDRPIIVGSTPNSVTPSPVTSANASQNVIMTGGQNRLEAEDRDGSQHLRCSSPTLQSRMHLGAGPYGFEAYTEGSGLNHFGKNLDVQVRADKMEEVGGGVTELYHATLGRTVHGAVIEDLLADCDKTVGGKATHTYEGVLDESVVGLAKQQYRADFEQSVDGVARIVQGTLEHTVKSPALHEYQASRTVTVTGADGVHVVGAQTVRSDAHQTLTAATQSIEADADQLLRSKTQTVSVAGAQTVEVGSHATTTVGDWIVSAGPTLQAAAQGSFIVAAAEGSGVVTAKAGLNLATEKLIALSGMQISISATGELQIMGAKVTIVSDAELTVQGKVVNVQADDVNVIGSLVKIN